MKSRRDNLPALLYSADQVRSLDAFAIRQLQIPGYELMTRAGIAALRVLRERWSDARRIVIVCGSGNNAGDGYVVARLAQNAGLSVIVIAATSPGKLTGDAALAWHDWSSNGGEVIAWQADALADADLIVDALFGVGLSRALDARHTEIIEAMNAVPTPVLALDLPSGLDGTTGQIWGACVRADCTVSFVGLKVGCFLGVAPDFVGALEFDGLSIPAESSVESTAARVDPSWLKTVLPPRPKTSHKGINGHVLVVGGGRGMPGAARLAGEAALRVGAGLVTIATCAENVSAIAAGRPELMVTTIDSAASLQSLMDRADVIAVGPGLGQELWSRDVFAATMAATRPLVVDADALNLLSGRPLQRHDWILTPHPGEAARLLGTTTGEIQKDRCAAVQALATRYCGIVVLKGVCTWIAGDGKKPVVCDRGNPGMAAGGMGDVLTGVVAGLVAQGLNLWEAARAGVLVHGLAGDAAAQAGERGMLASDLFPHLRTCVNPIRQSNA